MAVAALFTGERWSSVLCRRLDWVAPEDSLHVFSACAAPSSVKTTLSLTLHFPSSAMQPTGTAKSMRLRYLMCQGGPLVGLTMKPGSQSPR